MDGVRGTQLGWDGGAPPRARPGLSLAPGGAPRPLGTCCVWKGRSAEELSKPSGKHLKQKIAMLFPKARPLKPLLASVSGVLGEKRKGREELYRDNNFYLTRKGGKKKQSGNTENIP